jgi:hypothetical protein
VRPVLVEPVNIRKSDSEMIGVPSSEPGPVTVCTKPAGMPARSSIATAHRCENGVRSSGLASTALPATIAGNASLMPRVSG